MMEMNPENERVFYPFTNQFTFSMVMRDPAICKGLLDRILSDVGFREVRNTNNSTDEEILQTYTGEHIVWTLFQKENLTTNCHRYM